MADKSLMT